MDDREVNIAARETLAMLMGGEKQKEDREKVVEIQTDWRYRR